MRRHRIFGCFQRHQKGSSEYLLFSGNDENLIKNGAILLEERVSLFDGKTNPIRCFSVDDLNLVNVNNVPIIQAAHYQCYAGVWDNKLVLVKIFDDDYMFPQLAGREIAVATQMGIHSNVQRLLGCCLNTTLPVLVYQWAENGTLHDRILSYKEQSKEPLLWKERLRIGSHIAHEIAYLHTAFRHPIIYRNLKPNGVFLDEDDSARLSDFSLSISIPDGKKYVDDIVLGTWGYAAPEYVRSGRLTEKVDVFSFGVLLLVLLTGEVGISPSRSVYGYGWDGLVDLVNSNRFGDILDPAISINEPVDDEHFQCHLRAFIELAFKCLSEEEERRPTVAECVFGKMAGISVRFILFTSILLKVSYYYRTTAILSLYC